MQNSSTATAGDTKDSSSGCLRKHLLAISWDHASQETSSSQSDEIPTFAALVAAIGVLIHRYSGQRRVSVGATVATDRDLEDCCADLISIEMAGDLRVSNLVESLRERGARSWPAESACQSHLGASARPVFLFTLRVDRGSFRTSEQRVGDDASSAIRIIIRVASDSLSGVVEFDPAVFDEPTIDLFARHLRTITRHIIENPGTRVSEIDFMDSQERHKVLIEWNDTARPRSAFCIHELFETQAAETPNALALLCGAEVLAYSDLNVRANQLAHHLLKKGVGPEAFVGVYLDRSVEAIVALLAILKAGGAYVPLDPNYPQARISQIVTDSRLKWILSRRPFTERLRDLASEILFVDSIAPELVSESPLNPRIRVSGDNAAFLIYTSGSTGTPKGIVEIHRSMTARLSSAPLPDMRIGDVCALNSSLSFGISASRLFIPLAFGMPVVIVPDDQVKHPDRFASILESAGVTSIFVVPAFLKQLLKGGSQLTSRLAGIRAIVLGGGAPDHDLIRSARTHLPHATLMNFYGSTEIGTTATMAVISGEHELNRVLMGRAVANTRLYVLDGSMMPVPIGAVGDLYVGAEHLARGYLFRPELTAERFVPDPFSGLVGSRLYRTGDLCRFLPDGQLEFVGRADLQVKVRGFRIELGEIEAVLNDHPQVRESAVSVRETEGGEKTLIAHVVGKNGPAPSRQLRAYLSARLPDYMVPAAFLPLRDLPLTIDGKLDRDALGEAAIDRNDEDDLYESPRNSVEAIIANVWARRLGIARVGIHDDFFALGGHSLIASEVITEIQELLHVDVPVRAIFESPTVAEFAGTLFHGSEGLERLNQVTAVADRLLRMSEEEALSELEHWAND